MATVSHDGNGQTIELLPVVGSGRSTLGLSLGSLLRHGHVHDAEDKGKGSDNTQDTEEERAAKAKGGQKGRGNERPYNKATVAAYGEDAERHALVAACHLVGKAGCRGMEEGGAYAAHADSCQHGVVVGAKTCQGEAKACQKDTQWRKPGFGEFVAQKPEQGLG